MKGIVEGCQESDCQLLGGETAEMPGMYQDGEYDLAGFAVGAVKQDRVIKGDRILAGDVVIALPSSGVHSNGFSLVRKVLEVSGTSLFDQAPWDPKLSVGVSLLTPTALYVRDAMKLINVADVRGLVHITGGGFPENIPRVVPKGLGTKIDRSSWQIPSMFRWIQETGKIPDAEMFRTFNMGVGMIAIVPSSDVQESLEAVPGSWVLGEIINGEGVLMDSL